MAYEVSGYRLKIISDAGQAHNYVPLSQTVSGTVSTNILNASAAVDLSSFFQGSVIHVGSTLDAYTVASKSGMVITTVELLTKNYAALSPLRIDITSQWNSLDGYGNSALQADTTKQPGFVPKILNGLDAIGFSSGTKALTTMINSQTDDIFVGGGQVFCVLTANSDGGNNAGRIIERSTSGNSPAWNIVTSAAGGGFYRVLFNQVTTGTAGTWTTGSDVLLSTPQFFSIYYNSSTPNVPPIIRIIGKQVGVTTTTDPTGTAISDTGGFFTIGNRPADDRGLDGLFGSIYLYKNNLGDYDNQNMEMFLGTKYNISLFNNSTKFYGGRTYDISTPTIPATVPLLVCLHGGGGDGPTFEIQLQLGVLFKQKAAYIFPTATFNNGNPGSRTWNSNFPPPTFNEAPDSSYLRNLANFVKQQLVAQGFVISEVIVIGHSNGGMMGYRLLIDHPDDFAGLFAISSDVMVNNPDLYTGRIKHIHGQDDTNVPLAGGIGIGGNYYPPVIPTVQQFTLVNNGNGVIAGSSLSDDFTVLPSPAAHIMSSLGTALSLAPYSTTFAQQIYNFVFPS